MVASVVRKLIKSRNAKGKRTDLARERAERNLTRKRAKTVAEVGAKTSKPKIPPGTPVPKPPTTKSGARQVLKKFGVPGAIIAGVLATRDTGKTKATPKKVAAKPTRRRGPSGPTMTSVGRPSTGPKPRNKDRKVKPRRPSGPSMTGFRR